MRPFPGKDLSLSQRIFNYRLSRARRIVENAFGILAARFRIFRKPIEAKPENADYIVLASCVLHNYLKQTDANYPPRVRYVPPNFVDYPEEFGDYRPGEWREVVQNDTGMRKTAKVSSNNYSKAAMIIQEKLEQYFMTEAGKLPWQETVAKRGTNAER